MEFDAGTAVSVILGAFVALIGSGLTIAGLTAIIQGLGVTVVGSAIVPQFKPTIKVKRYNCLRRINVGGNGNAVGTKSYTDYTKAAYNGKVVEKEYRTGNTTGGIMIFHHGN
ncbi:MAG TPA: hypothetical protein GX525_04795 [Bacilli bacterium]|nr:hypothetical protein [Bacilli bacterium]